MFSTRVYVCLCVCEYLIPQWIELFLMFSSPITEHRATLLHGGLPVGDTVSRVCLFVSVVYYCGQFMFLID